MVSINTLIVGVLEMLALASSRKITIQVYVLFGFVCGLVSCNVCEFPLLINGALPYLVLPGFLCLFLVLGDVRACMRVCVRGPLIYPCEATKTTYLRRIRACIRACFRACTQDAQTIQPRVYNIALPSSGLC